MKTKSYFRSVIALFALASASAVLSTAAQAGDRRTGTPPPITNPGTAPVISKP